QVVPLVSARALLSRRLALARGARQARLVLLKLARADRRAAGREVGSEALDDPVACAGRGGHRGTASAVSSHSHGRLPVRMRWTWPARSACLSSGKMSNTSGSPMPCAIVLADDRG